MSNPTNPQHPTPAEQPDWSSSGHEPTVPLGNGDPSAGPYGDQPYGTQSGPQPYGTQPSGTSQYGTPPPGTPPYGAQQQGTQPLYGPPAGYGGPPPGHRGPSQDRRRGWLIGAAAALVVTLVGAGGAYVLSGGEPEEDLASTPASAPDRSVPTPTGSFTDGITTADPTPTPTRTPTAAPRTTPAERSRTLKDVDRGIAIYDDIYVQPAKGWRQYKKIKVAVSLVNPARGGGLVVIVDPRGYAAAKGVPTAVEVIVKGDGMVGVKKGPVRKVRPANSNISSQAEMSFTGRLRVDGTSVTLAGKCTTMTGVESIHNVTVSVCVEAPKAESGPAFRDAVRMLASVARSI